MAQDAAADELLGRDPLALLLGMLLDQHMRQRSSGAVGRPAQDPRQATPSRPAGALLRHADW
jgi:hypothetical protein